MGFQESLLQSARAMQDRRNRAQDLGFRVEGGGFRVRMEGLGLRIKGGGFKV